MPFAEMHGYDGLVRLLRRQRDNCVKTRRRRGLWSARDPIIILDYWESWGKRPKSSRLHPPNEKCQALARDGAGLHHAPAS